MRRKPSRNKREEGGRRRSIPRGEYIMMPKNPPVMILVN